MKSISSYLDKQEADPVQRLYAHIKFIGNLDAKLKQHLPDEIIEKFQLSNIDNKVATLHAVSAAWATRLRYLTPKILSLLNNELKQAQVASLRIRVHLNAAKQDTKRSISISAQSADFLKQHALSIDDDALKDCLLRLSKNNNSA